MKTFKLALMSACAVAGVSAANAQSVVSGALNTSLLQGAGATSIQTVMPQELACLGGVNQVGLPNGTFQTPANPFGVFTPTVGAPYNCATQQVQPATGTSSGFSANYLATGSGTGRLFFTNFNNTATYTAKSVVNPFTWAVNNVQFAFSDGPLGASDITAYAAHVPASAGAAIQIPLFVLPVAVAYAPQYGLDTTTGTALNLNDHFPVHYLNATANPVIGGIRMSKVAYCKIFNGEITNWNDASLKTLNGNVSLMDINDNATRWATDGAPIRLVGRADSSGTTDIFTRHLAVACTGLVATNKFANHAGGLPFLNTDPTIVAPGSIYKNGASQSGFAGTITSVSGAWSDSGTASNAIQGTEVPGKFLIANGSGNVSRAINLAPDVPSASLPTTLLNGKIGYIGTDFISPLNPTGAPSALQAAALQVGTSTAYAVPTAANATLAFGTTTPPIVGDTRISSATGVAVNPANPLDWTAVLYPSATVGLQNPVKGYAITGTTQFLTYTCFANTANRYAITEFLASNLKKITKDSVNAAVSSSLFAGTGATALGTISQAGLSPMPPAWQTAINNAFLSSTGAYSSVHLYIQSKVPTTTLTGITSNPSCTAGAGA